MVKRALKARGGFTRSTFVRGAKTAAKNVVSAGTKAMATEALRQLSADQSLTSIVKYVSDRAKTGKSPVGANGLSLEPPANRDITVRGDAVGDITNSSAMYMYRPNKRRLQDVGDTKYSQKTLLAGTITTPANQQSIFDVDMLTAFPVLNNPDTNLKYSSLTIKRCFDELMLASVANQTPTPTLKVNQSSIHLSSLTSDFTLVNEDSTVAAMVDIYELVPQHVLGPTTYFNQFSATGYMSPTWTYSTGLASDVIQLEDAMSLTDVASNPFNSTNFSRTWKVVKHVKVNMSAKGIHRHKSVYGINKTVSYQEFAQFSTSGGKFAGWNPVMMIIVRGNPTSANPIASAITVSYTCNLQLNYTAQMTQQEKVIVYDSTT